MNPIPVVQSSRVEFRVVIPAAWFARSTVDLLETYGHRGLSSSTLLTAVLSNGFEQSCDRPSIEGGTGVVTGQASDDQHSDRCRQTDRQQPTGYGIE